MKHVFGEFELDTLRGELRHDGHDIAVEPKVYALLCLLVDAHDRLVTTDEIIEKVWDGRAVSNSVVSTTIKGVRRALGDDGDRQEFVKTIRGRGFRFAAPVKLISSASAAPLPDTTLPDQPEKAVPSSKPTIAVIPFRMLGMSGKYSAIADALPAELISSLSRLRWLTVVARGSTFRFRGPETDLSTIYSLLGANYCLSGTVEIFGPNLTISVELSDSRTQQVVWAERIPSSIDNIHDVRAQIVNSTTAAMEIHIPLHEAGNARVLAPENLDAWNLYHLGLQHMYRFSRSDTEIAANYFERATELDPNFARAHAGRSFTSFQKAFLRNSDDIPRDKLNARKFAEKSLELDPLDPFGNFTFGRSFWLQDDADSALEWLERSVSLSPSFAKGYYAHAWTDVMAGRGAQALAHLEKSTQLSPLDPFSYAMQSSRGMAYAQKGDFENAAIWADKGARSPGSHYLIGAIAAAVHQLNNDPEKARYWVENVRSRRSDVSKVHFFQAFPFKPAADRKMWSDALTKCGI